MLTIITVIAIATGVCLEVVRRRMLMRWGSWIELTFGPSLFTEGLKPDNRQSVSENLRQLSTLRSFVSGQGLVAWIDLIWAPVFILVVFLISPALAYVVLAGSLVALVFGVLNERTSRDARNANLKSSREDRFWADAAERDSETISSKSMTENLKNLWFRSATDRLDESISFTLNSCVLRCCNTYDRAVSTYWCSRCGYLACHRTDINDRLSNCGPRAWSNSIFAGSGSYDPVERVGQVPKRLRLFTTVNKTI